MSEVVICARGVSKQYRVGLKEKKTDTFVGAVRNTLSAPFRNYKKIRDLTRNLPAEESVFWALKGVDFEVRQGEVLGIIGRNGAGKSTLLKILSRITDPTEGEVMIKGRVSSLLEVGTGFHPELTGRENVYMNGTILGMTRKEIDNRFDEIVDFSGVEKHLDTPVKFYSSGMKVRLAFSVAAHLEPEVLIIDEVLAVGDAEFQKKCMGKMHAVSSQGRTILFVSHSMLAIKSLCQTGMWLDKGRVVAAGDIDGVINAYMAKVNQNKSSFIEIETESEEFRIHSMDISNNGVNGNFDIDEDLVMKIEVTSKRRFDSINLNIFFNTMDGITIFAICSPPEEMHEGKWLFQCVVPARTLNDISYVLNLMVVAAGPKILHDLKEIVSIDGVEGKRAGAWLGKFPGLIRPETFQWNRRQL